MRILAILVIIFISFPAFAGTIGVPTPPGQPPIFKEMTPTQQAFRDAEEAAWFAGKTMRDWKSQMGSIDLSKDLENIIDALDATTRARIPAETLDKYNAKKSLRLLKP